MTTATAVPASPLPRPHLSIPAGVLCFARREFRDAIASRWFALYTVSFTVLAVAVSFISLSGVGSHGFAGFGKTTAGLLNLVMLVVPLMALIAGAGSIAGERERGTLLYLLAQPVSRSQVILGKYLGLAGALCCSLCIGFGVSAGVLAWRAGGVGLPAFALLVGLTCALALTMLSVGMLISVLSRRAGVATGIGLFVWLTLVFLSDLGLMAGTLLFKLRVQEVFALGILNPLQAFKMGVINGMNASLDVLGPVGVYASQTLGGGLPWLLAGVLLLWTAIPLAGATVLFLQKGNGVRRTRVPGVVGAAVLLVGGCGSDSGEGPPDIRLGDSICEECGMIISDGRFANATIIDGARGPEPLLFDDINCQAYYERAHPDLMILARWTHDYNTASWLPTERASFVTSPTLRTPMGSNTAAFGSGEEAANAARELSGDVTDFQTLWSRPPHPSGSFAAPGSGDG